MVGIYVNMSRRTFSSLSRNKLNLQSHELFVQSLSNKPTLQKLWTSPYKVPEKDIINAPSTIPIILRKKAAVFRDVSAENPELKGIKLQVKQYTTYAKSIIRFYRVGLQNVWRNRKDVNAIKNKYYVESVGKNGVVLQRKLKTGKDATDVLTALESLESIEQETLQKFDRASVLNLTRLEYLKIIRTEQDFFKIPLFAIILLIFAETTPLLCYVFPELAPSTCVFPGLLKKKYTSATKASHELSKLRKERYSNTYAEGEIPFHTVYSIPHDELRLLAQSLNLKSRYIPTALYPISILQARLQNHYEYIKVDNYYLTHGTDGNNVWNVSKGELIRACLERGLLDLKKDDLYHIGTHDMKLRLLFHLSFWNEEKSVGNVGAFGINQLGLSDTGIFENIDNETAHKVYGWWQHDHKEEFKHDHE